MASIAFESALASRQVASTCSGCAVLFRSGAGAAGPGVGLRTVAGEDGERDVIAPTLSASGVSPDQEQHRCERSHLQAPIMLCASMRHTAVVLLLLGCAKPAPVDSAWADGLKKFRAARGQSIGGPEGWLSLVARVPLEEGPNTIGSDAKCRAVLPEGRSPPLLGTLSLEGAALSFSGAPGADVRVAGQPVTTLTLADDSAGKPTVLEAGSLRLHVIRRGGAFLLRVKDREHPARAAFEGLDWFAPAAASRVRARLEPSPPGTTLPILNVLNQTEATPSPGHLVFTLAGREHRLAALKEDGPGFFVIFKDGTAGVSTYPAGRFIDTPPADAEGFVDLDFNRAYSPPCAFTSFATCPLPPRENFLGVKIEAGERYAGAH